MKRLIIVLLVFVFEYAATSGELEGPLHLTSFIENGLFELAREKSFVDHEEIKNITSYAGYVTVNKTSNSNTFFWFFPSQSNPKEDPVLLWFPGGLGITLSRTIFLYNGPFYVSDFGTLKFEDQSFTSNHSVIFIDHPVGTGYSYSDDYDSISELEVVSFLTQFFKVFSDYQKNDFFIGGDSYGGRQAVLAAREVKNCKSCSVNLKGVIIGNGAIDLGLQEMRADYMYGLGLLDEVQRDAMKESELKRKNIWDLVSKFTGLENPMSILKNSGLDKLKENAQFSNWLRKNETRRALHVGHRYFTPEMEAPMTVKRKIMNDLEVSAMPALENLLESHRVLMYNGQLDLIFPYQSTVNMIKSLKWSAVAEFKNASRNIWRVGGKVAGYSRSSGNLQEVMLRKAGHLVPFDQLRWTCKLLYSFTRGEKL